MFHQYLPESPSAANRFVLHERIEYVIIIVKLLDGFFFQENTQIFIGRTTKASGHGNVRMHIIRW